MMRAMPSRSLALVLLLSGFSEAACLVAAPVDTLEAVERASSEWVKVRAETVRLESQWATDRTLLESTIKALNDRAAELEQKREQTKVKRAEETVDLATIAGKNKEAKDDLEAAEARLKQLDEKIIRLRPKLPPRLSAALEMSFRSLKNKDMSLGERMQLTMTILNRCAQFNAAINTGEEELNLDSAGSAKSLEVIYWGLSHGYALERATEKAWWGSPGPEQWEWTPRPEAAAAVAQLIAANSDKADPAFVPVPVQLKHAEANGASK